MDSVDETYATHTKPVFEPKCEQFKALPREEQDAILETMRRVKEQQQKAAQESGVDLDERIP